jgi:hypothetical protein
MKTGLSDTTPDAEKVWIELLRKTSTTQRLAKAISLTQSTIAMAKRAIRRAHPDLSPHDADMMFISVHYGKDLTQKVDT